METFTLLKQQSQSRDGLCRMQLAGEDNYTEMHGNLVEISQS